MTREEFEAEIKTIVGGPAYNMEYKLVSAFAKHTGRPESEVSCILRGFIVHTTTETSGRGKYERATVNCCDLFCDWYLKAAGFDTTDLLGFIGYHEIACVYAVLLGQEGSKKHV